MISGQMIVYFLQKSKIGQGIVFCTLWLISLYGVFVFSQVTRSPVSTIQIIQNKNVAVTQPVQVPIATVTPIPSEALFVASSRGTYYYPISCNKAKSLSSKNMLYFKDKTAAEGAGYKPHSSC